MDIHKEVESLIRILQVRRGESDAKSLRDSYSEFNGLTDGWGALLQGLEKSQKSICGDLSKEEVEHLELLIRTVKDLVSR